MHAAKSKTHSRVHGTNGAEKAVACNRFLKWADDTSVTTPRVSSSSFPSSECSFRLMPAWPTSAPDTALQNTTWLHRMHATCGVGGPGSGSLQGAKAIRAGQEHTTPSQSRKRQAADTESKTRKHGFVER
eukprot:3618744-Rhodomonas_salina.2